MSSKIVALRKESVDRNSIGSASFRAYIVALRKESVDRNFCVVSLIIRRCSSLTAMSAWVEILPALKLTACLNVRSPQGGRG